MNGMYLSTVFLLYLLAMDQALYWHLFALPNSDIMYVSVSPISHILYQVRDYVYLSRACTCRDWCSAAWGMGLKGRVRDAVTSARVWRRRLYKLFQKCQWSRREVFSNTTLESSASMGRTDHKHDPCSLLLPYPYPCSVAHLYCGNCHVTWFGRWGGSMPDANAGSQVLL